MQEKLFSNLVGIQREMLKLIGEVQALNVSPLAMENAIDDSWHPKCDVFQTDTQWVVVAELAGVEKEEIAISLGPEYLRISGVRNFLASSCPLSYYNMEIETGHFERKIFFPELPLDKENPKVSYINGMLRIAFTLAPVVERIIPIS
ncbi:MAG: Hsp20/alpha crystallin family protein [Candidatus Cloacimonetes bacterium]|jgi:HSP20 family molecular chaperone IbpA|nr:Hsp20/alpha crystallin family protein [Candidatus Cloacimonadota bacterium]MDD2423152.1 Hsp20/alpha crystallin family protein [Candidatus Cloacimonadota bacterium]MDD3563034.1 Hsp20/alpha crystallin family protein [Candidatus Cloacimonadota bacterium]MDD4276690.1 Hsp20/alpha crystallin family protein [Candidatus Cloacimonadota bacterium]MDY0325119.1 Hsp20/alpha crystallin family protein [Candidatus Cloacimonadaceae bacterium]